MSESVVPPVADLPETADAPTVSKKSKTPEEASKKRKKSGPAASPSKPIPTFETVPANDPTTWGVNKSTEVEKMDVVPTGWGNESPSPASPLDWSDGIASKAGGFHTSPSEESGPSGRSSRNRHQRGEKQQWGVARGRGQGSKRVEAPPQESGCEEGASGSSEVTDPRLSRSSSGRGFGEENVTGRQRMFSLTKLLADIGAQNIFVLLYMSLRSTVDDLLVVTSTFCVEGATFRHESSKAIEVRYRVCWIPTASAAAALFAYQTLALKRKCASPWLFGDCDRRCNPLSGCSFHKRGAPPGPQTSPPPGRPSVGRSEQRQQRRRWGPVDSPVAGTALVTRATCVVCNLVGYEMEEPRREILSSLLMRAFPCFSVLQLLRLVKVRPSCYTFTKR